jgi:hypothetical protein
MYVSLADGCTKGFGRSPTLAPEIDCALEFDTDVRADESDGEVASNPDRDNRVMTSPERPHRPWLVPGAGRL